MSKFMHKKKRVYFLCESDDTFFNYAEVVKNAGYEVHIFDDHESAMYCCVESDLPDLMIASVFTTNLDTRTCLNLLELIEQRKKNNVPVLVMLKNTMDVEPFVESTRLTYDNIISYPIDQGVFLKKVENAVALKGKSDRQTVIFVKDKQSPIGKYETVLNESNFNVIHLNKRELFVDKSVVNHCRFMALALKDTDSSARETIKDVFSAYPDLILFVLANNVSLTDTIGLISMGVAAVIPDSAKPVEFLKQCLKILFGKTFQKWKYHADLRVRELQDTSELFRHVVENQKDLICKWHQDYSLSFVNDAFCRSLNSNRKEIIGQKITDFILPDAGESIEKITSETIRTNQIQTFEHGYIDSKDAVRWYHWTCSPVNQQNRQNTEILAVGRDISDMKKMELSLAEKNAEMTTLLATVPNQIWHLSDANTYVAANEAHALFVGKTMDELQNCPIDTVYAPDDVERIRQLNRDAIQNRKSATTEVSMCSGNGEKRVLSITQTPSLDDNGRVRFVICSARDITNEREQDYKLAFRAEFEHLISETVSEFVQHDISDIDASIQTSLQKIAQFAGINRAYIVFMEASEEFNSPNYCWSDQKKGMFTGIIDRTHTVFFKRLEQLKPICISDANEIDSSAIEEKKYFERNRLKSILVVPIEGKRVLRGFVVLESVDSELIWESDIQLMLKII
jgi:PAS domain S-box-containing protein